MGTGREDDCESTLGGYGGGGTFPELGMDIERSRCGGGGGYTTVLDDLSSDIGGRFAVGVRSRSCAAIFALWLGGGPRGGRSKELRLTRGVVGCGGLDGTFSL